MHAEALAVGDGTHEGRQLLHEVVDRLLLEVRLGEARERQVLLGERVEGVDLVADGGDETAGLDHVGARAAAHDVAEHLGIQLDGADGITHLVRDLERESAHRGHALGYEQFLLRGLQAAQQALHLAARPALAVGDDADDHRGQAEEHHEERDAGPADPRRRQGGRGRHQAAGGERGHEGDPRSEVVRIDRHEREEEQVEEALAAAGQQHQDEDEEQVDGQRAEEDGARGARLHGDQREDAELVEGEPDDEGGVEQAEKGGDT